MATLADRLLDMIAYILWLQTAVRVERRTNNGSSTFTSNKQNKKIKFVPKNVSHLCI